MNKGILERVCISIKNIASLPENNIFNNTVELITKLLSTKVYFKNLITAVNF